MTALTAKLKYVLPILLFLAPVFGLAQTESTTAAFESTKAFGITFESLYRGLIGMIFIIGICFLLSSNRKQIDWKLVGIGLA